MKIIFTKKDEPIMWFHHLGHGKYKHNPQDENAPHYTKEQLEEYAVKHNLDVKEES